MEHPASWNIQLPTNLEQEILRCLRSGDEKRELAELAAEYPDFASEIWGWAEQALQFRYVETADLSRPAYGPDRIGPYQVVRQIGAGGFGSVFLARDHEQDQPLAIKVLHRQAQVAIAGFQREMELLAELDHPTIVDIHDSGQAEDGRLYYVMDFVQGSSLDSFFAGDAFSNEQFLATLLQICDALSYIHRKGVIHRDVKPANILVDWMYDTPNGHLVDFGIASHHAPTSYSGFRMVKSGKLFEQTLHAVEGGVIGTPAFMAPEQILNPSEVDEHADLYAMGVTIYLMVAGRFPISPGRILDALDAGGKQSVYDTVMTTQLSAPTQHSTAVPEDKRERHKVLPHARRVVSQLSGRQRDRIDRVVLKCLEKEPEARYGDATEFAEQLAWAFNAQRLLVEAPRTIGNTVRRVAARIIPKRNPDKIYDEESRTTVWFMTDRKPRFLDSDRVVFGRKEGDSLTVGTSVVGMPKWRALGRLRPRWWERLFGNRKYSVIRHTPLDTSTFAEAIEETTDTRGALVFIHGYNTSFDEAIVRAAQLQTDLKMNGRIICYSWPSQARLLGYGADAAIVEASEKHLMDALQLLVGVSAHPFIHIMAHSMGNRALLRALSSLHIGGTVFSLGQIILAAPDVGQALFKHLYGAYPAHGQRCTIYASKHDRALMGSRFIHARGRAGYIPPLMVLSGIDTVDSSLIGFRLWGLNHSAYGDCREILTDISALIHTTRIPIIESDWTAALIPQLANPIGFAFSSRVQMATQTGEAVLSPAKWQVARDAVGMYWYISTAVGRNSR